MRAPDTRQCGNHHSAPDPEGSEHEREYLQGSSLEAHAMSARGVDEEGGSEPRSVISREISQEETAQDLIPEELQLAIDAVLKDSSSSSSFNRFDTDAFEELTAPKQNETLSNVVIPLFSVLVQSIVCVLDPESERHNWLATTHSFTVARDCAVREFSKALSKGSDVCTAAQVDEAVHTIAVRYINEIALVVAQINIQRPAFFRAVFTAVECGSIIHNIRSQSDRWAKIPAADRVIVDALSAHFRREILFQPVPQTISTPSRSRLAQSRPSHTVQAHVPKSAETKGTEITVAGKKVASKKGADKNLTNTIQGTKTSSGGSSASLDNRKSPSTAEDFAPATQTASRSEEIAKQSCVAQAPASAPHATQAKTSVLSCPVPLETTPVKPRQARPVPAEVRKPAVMAPPALRSPDGPTHPTFRLMLEFANPSGQSRQGLAASSDRQACQRQVEELRTAMKPVLQNPLLLTQSTRAGYWSIVASCLDEIDASLGKDCSKELIVRSSRHFRELLGALRSESARSA